MKNTELFSWPALKGHRELVLTLPMSITPLGQAELVLGFFYLSSGPSLLVQGATFIENN